MIEHLDIFLGVSLLTLIRCVYSDIKHGTVDGRNNSFMSGMALTLMLLNPVGRLVPYFGAIIIVLLFSIFIKNRIGLGDTRALFWLVPGFAIFNAQYAMAFLLILAIGNAGVTSIIKGLKMSYKRIPMFPIILGAFLTTWGLILFVG